MQYFNNSPLFVLSVSCSTKWFQRMYLPGVASRRWYHGAQPVPVTSRWVREASREERYGKLQHFPFKIKAYDFIYLLQLRKKRNKQYYYTILLYYYITLFIESTGTCYSTAFFFKQ